MTRLLEIRHITGVPKLVDPDDDDAQEEDEWEILWSDTIQHIKKSVTKANKEWECHSASFIKENGIIAKPLDGCCAVEIAHLTLAEDGKSVIAKSLDGKTT